MWRQVLRRAGGARRARTRMRQVGGRGEDTVVASLFHPISPLDNIGPVGGPALHKNDVLVGVWRGDEGWERRR